MCVPLGRVPGATVSGDGASYWVTRHVGGAEMLVGPEQGVRLPHRLDGSSAPTAREILGAAIDAAEASDRVAVVVDLSTVEWVDVTGLGLLAAAHVRCERGGRRLVLVRPRPSLRRLLAVSGLRKVLHVS